MNIEILEMIDGAKKAKGLTVIIDVFRAFSLETYLFARGAKEIYAVGKEQTARLLKMHHQDFVLIGERGGKILPGFDYGNSPFQTKDGDFVGKSIIHTTSAGTQGIINAEGASEIITGSLVNAKAIASYIRKKNPKQVSLVAMGLAGKKRGTEDYLCARYIKSLLLDEPFSMEDELAMLRKDDLVQKFFDPELQEIFPKEDYFMCIDYGRFDFVLRVEPFEKDTYRVSLV
ncbi:MAG: 2-phosphosulfolactate phosphatase [Eubacteriales bacterium]|nr:2-phosphosulfolactate phosphatase [Eubacteriales bacterium]